MDAPRPRRFRFQFRLRTLLIAMTLMGLGCSFFAREACIVAQRWWLINSKAVLGRTTYEQQVESNRRYESSIHSRQTTFLPNYWGKPTDQEPITYVYVHVDLSAFRRWLGDVQYNDISLFDVSDATVRQYKATFPEAEIINMGSSGSNQINENLMH
jgi:hypothetical protein